MKPVSILQSALSGLAWCVIVWLLLEGRPDTQLVIAMVISAPIGVLMGVFSQGFAERSILVRAFIALATLYGSAALFGCAMGVEGYLFGSFGPGQMRTLGLVSESIWIFVVGLTMTGYFVILWPLAYINHLLIARWALPAPVPSRGARGWR